MEENAKQIAQLLKVLANENRLLILCKLLEQPMTVGDLHEQINFISQSALSQHLAILKAYNIVDFQKFGQSITYSIKDERIVRVMAVLKENYC